MVDNKLKTKKISNKYLLDQEVYVLTHNKLVNTEVVGFKKNDRNGIDYTLKGFGGITKESNIFETPKDCFNYLEENITNPDSLGNKVKSKLDSVKSMFRNKL